MNWAVESGRPGPMGAHHDGDGVRFTVFSAHATSIEVCVFDSAGAQHLASFALPGRSGDLFHGFLRGAGPGLVYGLRAHGPWDLAAGHRFEPGRLLLDPAAREIVDRSNAAADFKARVIADRYDWQGDQPPDTPSTIRFSTNCTWRASPACTRWFRHQSAAAIAGLHIRRPSTI